VSTPAAPALHSRPTCSNQGFDALGRNILDYVLNPDHVKTLDGVLTYHVVAGAVTSDQLHDGEVVPTLDGTETVTVHIAGAEVRINNARVLRANIKASNGAWEASSSLRRAALAVLGVASPLRRRATRPSVPAPCPSPPCAGVIHVIDNVLVPSDFALPKDDIVTTAKSVASLSTLVTAVGAAGVAADLSAPNGPFTVFAPNNDAFAKLPAAELQYLLAHPAELRAILFYHVTDHRIYADEIKDYAVRGPMTRGWQAGRQAAGALRPSPLVPPRHSPLPRPLVCPRCSARAR